MLQDTVTRAVQGASPPPTHPHTRQHLLHLHVIMVHLPGLDLGGRSDRGGGGGGGGGGGQQQATLGRTR
jgi:hypothetical protein